MNTHIYRVLASFFAAIKQVYKGKIRILLLQRIKNITV